MYRHSQTLQQYQQVRCGAGGERRGGEGREGRGEILRGRTGAGDVLLQSHCLRLSV